MSDVILVFGATGQQGGAAARQLLAEGRRVRAFVRDGESPAAQALAAAGAKLALGDLADRGSVERAMGGVSGVFSVQTPFNASGTAGETQQGIAVAEAAQAAGVRHLVYSSVGGAERNSGVPHFESKRRVEERIAELGIPTTILRPVFFMENFSRFMRPEERDGVLTLAMALRPDKPLQLVAVEDIGAFAALAFREPGQFSGQAIELAGDELTPAQIAAAMSEVWGRPVQFFPLPLEQLQAWDEDTGRMFAWFNETGYAADIGRLRALYPPLHSFAAWLPEAMPQP